MIFGELFGGGGGAGTGLEMAGHDVTWSIEVEDVPAQTYQRNHPHTRVIQADIRDVIPGSLPAINALWMSPVCKQDSKARLKGMSRRPDASIGEATIPFIEDLQPELVIVENVSQYQKNPAFAKIVNTLLKHKYTLSLRVLDFADYGIPQTRERMILQARRGPIAWPDMAAGRVGWYTTIHDLFPAMQEIELANWQKQLWKPEYNKLIPLMVHGHYDYKSNVEGEERQLDILPAHLPARAVTSSHNVLQRYIVLPDYVLKPTIQAIARFQTFPDSYLWPASSTKAIEIIGNAVPPRFVQQLTKAYSQTSLDMEIVA